MVSDRDEARTQGMAPPSGAKKMKRKPAPKAERSAGASYKSDRAIQADSDVPEPYDANESDDDDDATIVDKAGGAKTRSWFPETFLFAPLVKTNAQGHASIEARVPDRLTRWRVLALAHSRQGAQAGALTSFLSTLPVYVDPVVPPLLAVGDEVQIPVQVFNTTHQAITRRLSFTATGARIDKASRSVTIPAGGSKLERVRLTVKKPSTGTFKATLAGADATEKPFAVRSVGKPASQQWSGSLAGPREIEISLPAKMEAGSARLRLAVYPGALALIRSELDAAPLRSTNADAAYLLYLAGRAKSLTQTLGGDIDLERLVRLKQIATQRALRHARAPTPSVAALFAPAALQFKDGLLARLGQRLAKQVAKAQRPDGTFFGGNGWPLQRVIVASADGLRVMQAKAQAARANDTSDPMATSALVRARTAFARFTPQINDGYTAAAVLSAAVVDGSAKERLIALVRKNLVTHQDGTRSLSVAEAVARGFDGVQPSAVEATALAVLALEHEASARGLLPDLGAYLLAAYRPHLGFGDGQTNLLALQAVAAVFREPLPTEIRITMSDGKRELATSVLEGKRLQQRVILEADMQKRGGRNTILVRAEPPIPGLAYHLTLAWTEAWPKVDAGIGLNVEETRTGKARVGRPLSITLAATAPGGAALKLEHRLPAGVQPDKASLTRLKTLGTISRFETEDGQVTLYAPRRGQGQSFSATYRVIPTLAGKLHMGPTTVTIPSTGQEQHVPFPAWTVGL